MKKIIYLLLLIVLFVPLLVNAETCDNNKVSIRSITLDDKSCNAEELNEATVQDNAVNLNLYMSNVGDNIKYRIIIKNDSNDDYVLNKNSIKVSSNYIDYNIESSDNNNIVKAKTAKAFYLNVLYKNQVPDNVFENGSFNDDVTMKLNLSSEKVENPNTGVMSFIFIVFVITIMIIMFILFKKKRKNNRFEFLIIGLVLLIPIGVKALCSVDVTINSNIKIDKPIVCGSFENDSWSVISHNVKNGNDACYKVGDTKEVELDGFGTHTVRIANKSTPTECNTAGFSQTACGFVVEFTDIVTEHRMNPYPNQSVNGMGNKGGWEYSEMRLYVNNDIYNALPIELKNIILNTTVISGYGSSDSENFTTTDKLYLLSTHEVWQDVDNNVNNGIDNYDIAYNKTRQLDYYLKQGVTTSNSSNAIKKKNNTNNIWWLRSADKSSMYSFIVVNGSGFATDYYSDFTNGVSPAFRIG